MLWIHFNEKIKPINNYSIKVLYYGSINKININEEAGTVFQKFK